jgi:hypothetical protein
MAESDGQVVFTVELDDAGFQEGMVRLEAALTTLGQNVLSAFSIGEKQLNEAEASGRRWVASFATGVRGSAAATTAVKSAVSAATSAASTAGYSGGLAAGRNIVAGIASGADGMGAALNASLTRIVYNALAAARRAAGISSPSKLFRDEVGRYLALGVQSGFTDTMAASVLPAIGKSVQASASAGRQALDGTLLAAVRREAGAGYALPDTGGISAATLGNSVTLPVTGAQAAAGGDNVTNVTQNITFEASMQAPDEVSRAIRRQATYGLAGARS